MDIIKIILVKFTIFQTPDSEGDAEMNDSSLLDSSTVTATDHNQIKDAFENRISELISDKITADSKATAFFLECEAVNYKLEDLSSQLLEKVRFIFIFKNIFNEKRIEKYYTWIK